jgi:ABC-type nickel/cobalt efflux system permease component RcnA
LKYRRLIIGVLFLVPFGAGRVAAHPVAKLCYDRIIRVRLDAKGVEVEYQIELSNDTVFVDIGTIVDDAKRATLRDSKSVHAAFVDGITPLLIDRLEAWQDDQMLVFARDPKREPPVPKRLPDDAADQLKRTLIFFAPWPKPIETPSKFRFTVSKPIGEEQIHLEQGRLDVAFADAQGVAFADRKEPSAAVKSLSDLERGVSEERQLRNLSATIVPGEAAAPQKPPTTTPSEPESPPPSIVSRAWRHGPAVLLESNLGIGLALLLAAGFGAAHALTPGHGKTLVAAYLVGQRGTIGHAVFLGFVTTVTHTGMVIILAAMLPWLTRHIAQERVQAALGFAGGLLVAGMGVWLLLRRLSGGADHVHIGGGHHHHHGPDGHHHHLPTGDRVRVWDLIVLGVSGGIVPCGDAIALLMMAIGTHHLSAGLPLLLAFSAGLAGVLVLIGVLVVKVKGFGSSRLGEGRIVKALPMVSAIVVTALGLWLCVESIG